jgi:Protein of unknown function (DUF3619)
MNNEQHTIQINHEDVTAKAIVAYLNASADNIDDNTLNTLAQARGQALNVYAQATQSANQHTGNGVSAVLRMFGDYFNHHRVLASSAMAISAMFVAVLVTQQFSQVENYGDGDAFLLGSDLPPEAYYDKGFDSWLERSS